VITRLQLLRNIGQFDNVSTPATLDLKRLTLVYAENGRGKTTLAAILRSLGTGEALPINERKRLGAAHPPEVRIACEGGPQPAAFVNGVWDRTCPAVMVFDDVFVDRNVYSGLDVAPEHRQNLHDVILGAEGVTLARRVDDLATQIRNHNSEIRTTENAIAVSDRHGLSIEDFCALPQQANIDDAILAAEQRLAALQQAGSVQSTAEFSTLGLPALDSVALSTLLGRTVANLDAAAVAAVQEHFTVLGNGAEAWVSTGVGHTPGGVNAAPDAPCPFCRQSLAGSTIFAHYRAYFGDAYRQLQADLASAQTTLETAMRGDALAGFERQVKTAEDRQRFWAAFCAVPSIGIDTTAIARAWQNVRDRLLAALRTKRADPLVAVTLDADARAAVTAYTTLVGQVAEKSRELIAANENIQRVKEATRAGDTQAAENEVKRLKATKARHTPENTRLCDAYTAAVRAKAKAEQDKSAAQQRLNAHRDTVFPAYQTSINSYLARFNAGFSIEQVQPQNTGGRPSCTYQLVVNTHRVPVASGNVAAGAPSFKNTMSAGDRNTLALAFFLSTLAQDAQKATRVVVFDDPVSSLDEHRCVATIQEARGLVGQVAQVIVLSHSKSFLARIWQHADHANTTSITVTRDGAGSTLAAWNVTDESVTEYDKRHARLREYATANTGNSREVAQSIRPVLEGFMRVSCPEHFPPGTLLGPFRGVAQQRATAGTPIMDAAKLTELGNLIEYSNRFHHDTNPAWDAEHINDAELAGFVRRALDFVKP
jgi:wobble nucleotide-excising tRNase